MGKQVPSVAAGPDFSHSELIPRSHRSAANVSLRSELGEQAHAIP